MGAGSGVIIDAKHGLIVTNHHVITNVERIIVTVKDGQQFKAKLLGSDEATGPRRSLIGYSTRRYE